MESLCYCISCFIFSALAGRFVSNFCHNVILDLFFDGPPLVFSALLRFNFWGLCCAEFKQAARFDVFSFVVVPPQGFLFCHLFFVKLFDKFWRFSRPRVSNKFDCPNTSRKYSSTNASLLMGDLFRIDAVQPSLESSDLLPQRSRGN